MRWLSPTHQLIIVELRPFAVHHEPPSCGAHRSGTYIATHGHVPEEQPTTDKRLFGTTRRTIHDIQIGAD